MKTCFIYYKYKNRPWFLSIVGYNLRDVKYYDINVITPYFFA